MVNKGTWRKEEDDFLKANYAGPQSVSKLAEKLRRTKKATYRRCVALGLTRSSKRDKPRRWTTKEKDYLRKHFKGKPSIPEIAQKLNRSETATYHKALELGLAQSRSTWKKWTKEEKEYLRKHYRKMTYKEIGKKLGRSENAINAMVQRMGLAKK